MASPLELGLSERGSILLIWSKCYFLGSGQVSAVFFTRARLERWCYTKFSFLWGFCHYYYYHLCLYSGVASILLCCLCVHVSMHLMPMFWPQGTVRVNWLQYHALFTRHICILLLMCLTGVREWNACLILTPHFASVFIPFLIAAQLIYLLYIAVYFLKHTKKVFYMFTYRKPHAHYCNYNFLT